MTLTRLGRHEEAAEIVKDIKPGHEVQYADCGYYNRVLVYNGTMTPEEALKVAEENPDGHYYATAAYGIARYYLSKGETEKAWAILKKIADADSWGGFAEHAARVDVQNWPN